MDWKWVYEMIIFWSFRDPPKSYQNTVEKSFGPMSFLEKLIGGNKKENVPFVAEQKIRDTISILYQILRRKYPPKWSKNDPGRSFHMKFFGHGQTIMWRPMGGTGGHNQKLGGTFSRHKYSLPKNCWTMRSVFLGGSIFDGGGGGASWWMRR